ncbi:hypothetical protein T484DRAFT_1770112 [Baffinella frigidus]|nr:hypothetical protein T484DRAFT_1770112 [Cryptophyta sp. CCMP2293]
MALFPRGSEGQILGDINEANTLLLLLPIAEALAEDVQIRAHMETTHAHQDYTMLDVQIRAHMETTHAHQDYTMAATIRGQTCAAVDGALDLIADSLGGHLFAIFATIRGQTYAAVDEALDLIADSLGEHLFAIHRPPRPEKDF